MPKKITAYRVFIPLLLVSRWRGRRFALPLTPTTPQLLERSIGPDNPKIVPTIADLSLVKRRLERVRGGRGAVPEGFALQQGVLDSDHPEMARILQGAGGGASSTGKGRGG